MIVNTNYKEKNDKCLNFKSAINFTTLYSTTQTINETNKNVYHAEEDRKNNSL